MNAYLMRGGLVVFFGFFGAEAAAADCGGISDPLQSPRDGALMVRFSPFLKRSVGVYVNEDLKSIPPISIEILPDADGVINEPFDKSGGRIFYLEGDGGAGRRICREEEWRRRDVVAAAPVGDFPEAVRKIFPYFEMKSARDFLYDKKGRLASIRYTDATGRNETRFCALYDEMGRIQLASTGGGSTVSEDPAFDCSQLRTTPSHSATRYFHYRADGTLALEITKSLTRKTSETSERGMGAEARDGAWRGYGNLYMKEQGASGRGTSAGFSFNEKHGITDIKTSDFAIIPADATPVFSERATSESRGLRYTFPAEPVPIEVAKGQFEGVTGYTRVREFLHRSGRVISEVFAPNASTPVERQWRALDLSRQENYDDSGKLKRVILFGRVPSNGYSENLRAYAEQGVLKVTPITSGYSSYRVYDYDAAGKETLSLVCWRHDVPSNKPYAHFPWWEADPRPKRGREAELQYGMKSVGTRCGTPDGKMIIEGMGPIKRMMESQYGFGTTKLKREQG